MVKTPSVSILGIAEQILDKIKPDSKTTILAWKVFPVETGAQAVPPWPGNPDKKF